MKSQVTRTSIKGVLKQGLLVSLCLSAIIGAVIVATWQVVSQRRANAVQEGLVRNVIVRDSEDLTTSFVLKNYEGVLFQLKSSFEKLPVKCSYLQLPDRLTPVIGDYDECRKSEVIRTQISSNGVSFGPLYYVLNPLALPEVGGLFLVSTLLGLVFALALTWGVLLYLINRSILNPLSKLTRGILEKQDFQEFPEACEEVKVLAGELRAYKDRLSADIRREELLKIASQVAHDIRSPLAALAMAERDLSRLPEDTRIMIRSAVGRIRDISNHLLERNRALVSPPVNEELSTQLLFGIIESVLTEKRMQFRAKIGVEIEARLERESYGLFARVQTTEFKRVISNLINNAVEAMSDVGSVFIGLKSSDDWIEISVQDNGKGIAPEIMARLTQRGETHGKVGGSGLGLFHARSCCETWGGALSLSSELGVGTTLRLRLPRAKPPEWFVGKLRLQASSKVVVLDDDQSIHGIWRGRMESARARERGVELVHLSTPDELYSWCHSSPEQKNVRYLIDFELLGFTETGLDLIESLGIAQQSVLVTSRFEEPGIRRRCTQLRVPLIPKGMAGFVPIEIQPELEVEISAGLTTRSQHLQTEQAQETAI